ncbi:hypothetical protein TGP89_236560 [Toxoplasma gondii p89]|uniref:Uncharacterized protein n=1 Tax=Toxoplasma gondii p89 TaxID=943119 RepID=A0A086JXC0_TOXGO|nr:hypothetical protein TGP89_236560 [Toxoplasma gondii p89]
MADVSETASSPPSPHGLSMREEAGAKESACFSPTTLSGLSPLHRVSSPNFPTGGPPEASFSERPRVQMRPAAIPQLRLGLQFPKPSETPQEPSPVSSRTGSQSPLSSPCRLARTCGPSATKDRMQRERPCQRPPWSLPRAEGEAQRTRDAVAVSSRPPLSPSKRRAEDVFCPSPASMRAVPGPRVWWALPVLGATQVSPQLSSGSRPQSPTGGYMAPGQDENSPGAPSCCHEGGECRCLYASVTQAFHDQMRTAAPPSLLAAVEQFAESSLLCRLEPLAAGSAFPRNPAALAAVRRQHALVLFHPSSPLAPPEAFSIQNLVQTCGASKHSCDLNLSEEVESLRSQLAAQQQRFDAFLESDANLGELKRELWRFQLLQMQDQSRLKKQTAKIAEALEVCSALAALPAADGTSAASTTGDGSPPTPSSALTSPGGPPRPRQEAQLVSRLLNLLQEAAACGAAAGGANAEGAKPSGSRRENLGGGGRQDSGRDDQRGRQTPTSSAPSPVRAGPERPCALSGLSPCGAGDSRDRDIRLHERMQTQQPRACVPPLFGLGDVGRGRARGEGFALGFPGSPAGGRPDSGCASRRSLSSSSYCSSRSNVTTYRGHYSGDEGSRPPSVRRRVGSGGSGRPLDSRPVFVSTWKGRPAFVPRLNLTGDDSDEEEAEEVPPEAPSAGPGAATGGKVDGEMDREMSGEAGSTLEIRKATEESRGADDQGLVLRRQSDEKSGSDMKDLSEMRDEEASRGPQCERLLDSDVYHLASQRGSVCASGLSSGEESLSGRLLSSEKDGHGRQASLFTFSSSSTSAAAQPVSPALCPDAGSESLSHGSCGALAGTTHQVDADASRAGPLGQATIEKIEAAWTLQQFQRQERENEGSGPSDFCLLDLDSPAQSLQTASLAAEPRGLAGHEKGTFTLSLPQTLEAGEKKKPSGGRQASGFSLALTPSSTSSASRGSGNSPTRGYSGGSSSVCSSSTEGELSHISSGRPTRACSIHDNASNFFSRASSILSPSAVAGSATVGVSLPPGRRDDGATSGGQGGGETRKGGTEEGQYSPEGTALLDMRNDQDGGGAPEAPSREPRRGVWRPAPLSAEEQLSGETVGQLRWTDGDRAVMDLSQEMRQGTRQPTKQEHLADTSGSEEKRGDELPKTGEIDLSFTGPAGAQPVKPLTDTPAAGPQAERGPALSTRSSRAGSLGSPAVSVSSCSSPSVAELRRAFESGQMWGGSVVTSPKRVPSTPSSPSGQRRRSTGPWTLRLSGSVSQGGTSASPGLRPSLFSLDSDGGITSATASTRTLERDKGSGPTSERTHARDPYPPPPAGGSSPTRVSGSETCPTGVPRVVGVEETGEAVESKARRGDGGATEGPPAAREAAKDDRVPAFSRGSLFPSSSGASCANAYSRGQNEPEGAQESGETQRGSAASPDEARDRPGNPPKADPVDILDLEISEISQAMCSELLQDPAPDTDTKETNRSGHLVPSPGSRGQMPSSPASGCPSSTPFDSEPHQPRLVSAEKETRTDLFAVTNMRSATGGERRNGSIDERGGDCTWNEGEREKPEGDSETRERTPVAFPACVEMTCGAPNASCQREFVDVKQRAEELRCIGVDPGLVFPQQTEKLKLSEVEERKISRLVTGDFAAGDGCEAMDLREPGDSSQGGDLAHDTEPLRFWSVERADSRENGADWSTPASKSPLAHARLPEQTGAGSQLCKVKDLEFWPKAGADVVQTQEVGHGDGRLGDRGVSHIETEDQISSQALCGKPLTESLSVASFALKTGARAPLCPSLAEHGEVSTENRGDPSVPCRGDTDDLVFAGPFDACARETGELPEILTELLATGAPGAASAPCVGDPSSLGSGDLPCGPSSGVLVVNGFQGRPGRENATHNSSDSPLVQAGRQGHGFSLPLHGDDGGRHRSVSESGRAQLPETLHANCGVAGPGSREFSAKRGVTGSLEAQPQVFERPGVSAMSPAGPGQGWRLPAGERPHVEQRQPDQPQQDGSMAPAFQCSQEQASRMHAAGSREAASSALLSALLNPPFDPLPADLHMLLATESSDESLGASGLNSLSSSESSSLALPLPGSLAAENALLSPSSNRTPENPRGIGPGDADPLAHLLPFSRRERAHREKLVGEATPSDALDANARQANVRRPQQGAVSTLQPEPPRGAPLPQTQVSGMSGLLSPGTLLGGNARMVPQFIGHAHQPRPLVSGVSGQPVYIDRVHSQLPLGLQFDVQGGRQGGRLGEIPAPVSRLSQAANFLQFQPPQATQPRATCRSVPPQPRRTQLCGGVQTLEVEERASQGGPQTDGRLLEMCGPAGLRGLPAFRERGFLGGEGRGDRGMSSVSQGPPQRALEASRPLQPFPFRTMSQQQIQENLQRQILLTAARSGNAGMPDGNLLGTEFWAPGQQAPAGLPQPGTAGVRVGLWRGGLPQGRSSVQAVQHQLLQRQVGRTEAPPLVGQVAPGDRADVNRQETSAGEAGLWSMETRHPGQGEF